MAEQRTLEAERTEPGMEMYQCPFCDRRAAPPALGEDGLPPLPRPDVRQAAAPVNYPTAWSEEAVRQAQREAVADRPTWADVQAREKDIRALQSEVIELRAQFARQSAPEGAPVAWRYRMKERNGQPASGWKTTDSERVIKLMQPEEAWEVQPLYAPASASAQPADQNKMEKNDE